jgi:hypothetical protein
MKRRLWGLLPLVLVLLSFSTSSLGSDLWTGIIDPSRAVDWTQAGFPGDTLPDATWMQCGATLTAAEFGGSSTAPASADPINLAIAACGANQYVSLGAGTFYLDSPLTLSDFSAEKSNVVLRGQGADSTFLVYSGSSAGGGCFDDVVNLEGDCQYVNGGEENVCDLSGASTTSTVITGTYAQGATYVSLANCGTTTPAVGSLANLKVGSILILDQLNETNDTGTIWNCDNTDTANGPACAGNGSGGGVRENGPCNDSTCDRSEVQGFVVTAVSGSTVQISPGLYVANWRTSQKPQATFATHIIQSVGIENLSIDTTAATGFVSTIGLVSCNGCWVSGVRSIDTNRSHIRFIYTTHSVMRDSYLYKNQTGATSSYGMEIAGGWNNLIENNITQQITDSDPSCTAPCAGNVLDYNFDVDNAYTAGNDYIVPPFFLHASGDAFNLWEGNIGPAFSGDNIHGTHHFETVYRNTLPGWQSQCTGGACLAQTIPVTLPAGDRYMNIIGNVMGQAGYHTAYQCEALTSNVACSDSYTVAGKDEMIYELNYVEGTYPVTYTFCLDPTCAKTGGWDPEVSAYLMRWGNYDVVTGAARFCGNASDTGWSTTCGSTSEVPTTIEPYSNAVPSLGDTAAGQSPMPASFYFSSKPAFLGATPFPAAGPEVTGGNLGNCSGGVYAGMAATATSQCTGGTLAPAWAGHSNANAAMTCYLSTMGGPADGTGDALSFNAASCYPSSTASHDGGVGEGGPSDGGRTRDGSAPDKDGGKSPTGDASGGADGGIAKGSSGGCACGVAGQGRPIGHWLGVGLGALCALRRRRRGALEDRPS